MSPILYELRKFSEVVEIYLPQYSSEYSQAVRPAFYTRRAQLRNSGIVSSFSTAVTGHAGPVAHNFPDCNHRRQI